MNKDNRLAKWASIVLPLLVAIMGQTWVAARWTKQVEAGLSAVQVEVKGVREAQIEMKRELKSDIAATKADLAASESRMNRRIERLEDFDRNRKTVN